MYRFILGACVFVLQVCLVTSLYAERPPEARKDASYVITGTVDGVYLWQTQRYNNYVIKILVEKVDRGTGIRPGDFFYASCFQRRPSAPPEPSAQGHRWVPRLDQRIRAYVNERNGEHEGVYADWFDAVGR